MASILLIVKFTHSTKFILPIILLAMMMMIMVINAQHEGGAVEIDFDPKDKYKSTFCSCQCCTDTMCNDIPNATFAVASCFECTKYVCDALDYPCKTTLFRAQCVQKNDLVSQIIISIVLIWIFAMIVGSIGKAYIWPIIMKIRKRRMEKAN